MAKTTQELKQTVLHGAHLARGARMTPFAGYDMPVQYKQGVLAEHRWTREHAGLFDVSHMGPSFLVLRERTGDAEADHAAVAALVEPLLSADIAGLKPGQNRYSVLLNEAGGILDDLMVGRPHCPTHAGALYIVVNADTKEADFALIAEAAQGRADLQRADAAGLIALQGPEAHAVLADQLPELPDLGFMQFRGVDTLFGNLTVSRSGYTGEDGYEILVAPEYAAALWEALLSDARVKPIGLGARDSLRLEAGLPLYGHDMDADTSPFEASLGFAVSKKRLKAGQMRGAARLQDELARSPKRVRVGLFVEGAPAREGAEIADANGAAIGRVTSGGPSPTLGRNIAMGYVPADHAQPGTRLQVVVRGRAQLAEVAAMPFVAQRYVRKGGL